MYFSLVVISILERICNHLYEDFINKGHHMTGVKYKRFSDLNQAGSLFQFNFTNSTTSLASKSNFSNSHIKLSSGSSKAFCIWFAVGNV
jgi:hypothetical protein